MGLVLPHALNITKHYELTHAQAQALVDLEAQCADLGLTLKLSCRICQQTGEQSVCEGDALAHDDGTMSFIVKCSCQKRVYRGTLRAPVAPRGVRDLRVDLTVKPEVQLPREVVKRFQDADAACLQLKLSMQMRCIPCRLEDRPTDGVWGARETNASQYVLECACTRRIYRGSDVKLVH
jgi:hypothetical protein